MHKWASISRILSNPIFVQIRPDRSSQIIYERHFPNPGAIQPCRSMFWLPVLHGGYISRLFRYNDYKGICLFTQSGPCPVSHAKVGRYAWLSDMEKHIWLPEYGCWIWWSAIMQRAVSEENIFYKPALDRASIRSPVSAIKPNEAERSMAVPRFFFSDIRLQAWMISSRTVLEMGSGPAETMFPIIPGAFLSPVYLDPRRSKTPNFLLKHHDQSQNPTLITLSRMVVSNSIWMAFIISHMK